MRRQSKVLVLLEPGFNILRIPLEPANLRADGVLALSEVPLETLGALLFKERLNILELVLLRETARAHGDDRAHHGERGWQLLDQRLPVLLHPAPERHNTLFVCPQA